MNNTKESKFLSWLRSIGLSMYEENFSRHGYDDLDLLTMMDDEEESQVFQILGITMHGHVLKLKKCLRSLRPASKQGVTQTNAFKPVQGTSKQGSKCFNTSNYFVFIYCFVL